MLCNYGINSNTSANSFLKCIFRKAKNEKPSTLLEQLAQPVQKVSANHDSAQVGKELTKQPLGVHKVNMNGA